MGMNRLALEIGRACCEHLLEEKWLVAPSRRVGAQWIDAVSRGGRAVANCHVQTILGLAMELAHPAMAENGLSLASPQAGAVLIDRIWSRQRRDPRGYLFSLLPSAGLSRTVYKALTATRMAGLDAAHLPDGDFEVEAKATELASIAARYLRAMKDRKLIDPAELIRLAIDRLRREPSALAEVLVMVPADLDLRGLEQELIAAIPRDSLVMLAVDEPCRQVVGEETLSDAAIRRWLPAPGDSPPGRNDGTAKIFHAMGEVNEVREVVRRCLAAGCSLDDVELLYAEAETYIPLIYELGERLSDADGDAPGLGLTFAEGLPVRYSRPGRALAAWLEWIAADCPQSTLLQMIQDGLLNIPARNLDEDISFSRLATWLRGLQIGFGRDRYVPLLDEKVEGLRRQVEGDSARDEDRQTDPDKANRLNARLQGTQLLRTMVNELLTVCPAEGDSSREVLRKSVCFLETCARSVSEMDNFARRRIIEEIQELAVLLDEDDEATSLDVGEFLSSLPGRLRVMGSGPRPGCLHVAHVLSGGHSGRGHTFIVGLDDHRFPGAGLQDPLLLDGERQSLSPHLRTAAGGLRDRLDGFARLLCRLRGKVTLSFASRDLNEDREMFPSPVVLSAFRMLSGNEEADQRDMMKALGPPVSFAPAREDQCLDANEWWLWAMCGDNRVESPRQLLVTQFAHLGRGLQASHRRRSDELTVYDGLVAQAGVDKDPARPDGPVLSASGLETLGTCPLRYFFRYVLRIELPDEHRIDPSQWLDAAQFGLLLHEVFCVFMRELLAEGKLPPVAERDEKRLQQILDEHVGRYRQLYAPPSESAFRRQYRQLQDSARIFLTEEEIFCQSHQPVFLEATIGMPSDEEGTEMDSPEPVEMQLADGRRIRIRGRIDRVDRLGGPGSRDFCLWDYKSSSAWKYDQDPPLWQGRILQHALYLHLAQSRLAELHPGACVKEVGYFFPSPRGQGERKVYTPEELACADGAIQDLCGTIAHGAFIATNSAADCTYCDYAVACGDLAAQAEASARKLQADSTERLDAMRALRGIDHE